MAQIRFEDIQENNNNQNRIGYFSLKNHGDEAIIRIMHDSTDSFEIVSTHQIEVNGKYRRINCARTPFEPVDNCPICATGKNAQQRFYMHLIQYSKNEAGQIVAEPKIWERPVSFATTIKNLITNYGPLSESIFKIHRNGAARAMDTTYDIMYMPPNQFPENIYPKMKDAFDGYSVIGTAVMNRSVEDIITYLQTGNFPMIKRENAAPQMNTASQVNTYQKQNFSQEIPQVASNAQFNATPNLYTPYVSPQSGFIDSSKPNEQNIPSAVAMERPVRYY